MFMDVSFEDSALSAAFFEGSALFSPVFVAGCRAALSVGPDAWPLPLPPHPAALADNSPPNRIKQTILITRMTESPLLL
ncbi:hypothetical protein [Cohnella nanjingensis]|uniref:hypothetical protein n=1 Tax=Cohnella nanjingensis TaxID=1387779 RepID=UPI001C87F3D3|nr:hypothetical protein [Cohnella nanjingensis]